MIKTHSILLLGFLAMLLPACEKNMVSKIPQISILGITDSIRVNTDTAFIKFSLTDGDGDIGNDNASQIFIKDNRFDSLGFSPTPFPPIDPSIEDPKKGLTGTCLFYPIVQPVPRPDSNHFNHGDTMYYEVYITDRAGHESNHIFTPKLIIRP